MCAPIALAIEGTTSSGLPLRTIKSRPRCCRFFRRSATLSIINCARNSGCHNKHALIKRTQFRQCLLMGNVSNASSTIEDDNKDSKGGEEECKNDILIHSRCMIANRQGFEKW